MRKNRPHPLAHASLADPRKPLKQASNRRKKRDSKAGFRRSPVHDLGKFAGYPGALARTPIEALERQAAKQPMTAGVNQHTEALWKVTTGLYENGGGKICRGGGLRPASRGTGATR